MDTKKVRLPYSNNAVAVLITVVINVAVVFIFAWPGGTTLMGAVLDTIVCVVITVIVNMLIVYPNMEKTRALGAMPAHVPENKFMQKLPSNPFLLGVVYVLFFGVITVGLNALILWFFEMTTMEFVPWMTYKLIYSTVLSIKITEYCIYRFVQPDWALANDSGKTRQDTSAASNRESIASDTVKDPLPKISIFAEMFGSVTSNIAMNILIGSLLGGVVLTEGDIVAIMPTTVEGIPITGLVFGLIVGILVTRGVVKAVNQGIVAPVSPSAPGSEGNPPAETPSELPPADKRFTWMPKGLVPLTCLICVCTMAFSAVMLPLIMTLFGATVFNFYQFTIFITIYASLLSKPLSYILVKRCMQPDYIAYTLAKSAR